MLIALEGPDGSGKSVVAKAVAKALDADFIEFPNDKGVTGPMIRSYLAKKWGVHEHMKGAPYVDDAPMKLEGALAFQALQLMNRMEEQTRIRHADNVVCARYWQSGYVYGSLDGLDGDFLIRAHEGMIQPDLNILLDVDVETSLERMGIRGEKLERYEGKPAFMQRVRGKYQELWGSHATTKEVSAPPNHESIVVQPWNWPVVDASQDLVEVVAEVMNHVFKNMEEV